MTAQARISQADIDRATKVAAKYEHARVILDLAKARIEIIIGDHASDQPEGGYDADDA